VKIPVTEQIMKYSDQPVWHQQPYYAQNCPILTLSLEFRRLTWPGPQH